MTMTEKLIGSMRNAGLKNKMKFGMWKFDKVDWFNNDDDAFLFLSDNQLNRYYVDEEFEKTQLQQRRANENALSELKKIHMRPSCIY